MVPKIRFSGFEDEWNKCRIDELLIERNEQAPVNNEYPLSSFVAHKGVVPKTDRYDRTGLTKDLKNKPYKKTELGDFIYSSNNLDSGSIGLNRFGKSSISPVYSIFFTSKNADSDFIGYRLIKKDFINKMLIYRHGVIYGQLKIDEANFMNLSVQIPSLTEQRLIGSFFRSLDDLIGSQESRVRKLRGSKRAFLNSLFPGEEEKVPKLRFPGFTEEWQECSLGDVVKLIGGNAWKHSNYDEYGKYLVVTISNVTGDQHIRDDIGNHINCDDSNCFILQKEDILISLTGNVGRVSKMSDVKAVLNQRVGKVIPIDNKIDNNFLFSVLNNPSFENRMDFDGQGAAQKNISNNNVLLYNIKLPSLQEQRLIGSFFRTLDNLIESEEFYLRILKGAKKSLLSGMFV